MKILCETQVINRQTQMPQKKVKATLGIGFCAKNSAELQILHFTPQCKTGFRYKVNNNIENVFTRFINDGKATISFINPEHNLLIKCDPIQLKGFLRTLNLGIKGKSLHLKLNAGHMKAISQKSHPVTRLNIQNRADYPTKGFPRGLKSLTINAIDMHKVPFQICGLSNLTVLNLSENAIRKIPNELGRLQLIELNLNNNYLGEQHNWKWLTGKELSKSLINLDLSDNKLTYFPREIIKLSNLVNLKLSNNSITKITFGIRGLTNLKNLHMSTNSLVSLPSALNYLRLDILDVWGNNFQPKSDLEIQANYWKVHQPAPLWLMGARTVAKYKIPCCTKTIPWNLVDFMSQSPKCSCGRLCYSENILERAVLATFENVKNLVFSRDQSIYADIVVCSLKCAARNSIQIQGNYQ